MDNEDRCFNLILNPEFHPELVGSELKNCGGKLSQV